MTEKLYDVLIIGAGAAGLTAAIYARRAGKSVLVLESTAPGGQIINTTRIENYPAAPHISGTDFATAVYNQARDFAADFAFEKVLKLEDLGDKKRVTTEDETYLSKTVILATGTTDRKLGLENEAALVGRGVSYCATCDGHFFEGQPVAVEGGGNTALYSALYLAGLASDVYLLHRRSEFRADAHLVEKAEAVKNLHFLLGATVLELRETDDKLSEIVTSTGETLKVSALFVAIGRVPDNNFVKDLVALDDSGYIKTNELCETNVPGIYAAGDCRAKSVRQLVTATGDGATAATAAINYLNQKP